MEKDFHDLLLAAVTSLVGTRVYPSNYRQNADSPAVRFAKISGAPGLHMQGGDGLNFDLVQVDARGTTAQQMLDIRDAVVSALHSYHATQGATEFQLIALRDDRGWQFDTTGAQQFYTASMDLDVIWRAA